MIESFEYHNELVSIVLPVYNCEKTIARCLDSLLSQDHRRLEVIIVDDGSQDKSDEICRQYESYDKRVRYFRKNNEGAGSARNLGIIKTSGTWITFVDADDWLDPLMIKAALELIFEKNVDAVFFNCTEVSNTGSHVPLYYEKEMQLDGRAVLKSILSKESIRTEVWGKLYRAELLADCVMDTDVVVGEDLLYLLQIFNKHPSAKCFLSPLPYYFYNQVGDSIMRSDKMLMRNIKLLKRFVRNKNVNEYPESYSYTENYLFITRMSLMILQDNPYLDGSVKNLINICVKKCWNQCRVVEKIKIAAYLLHPMVLVCLLKANTLISRWKSEASI